MAEKTGYEAVWTLIQSFQETNQAITESFVTSQERSRRLAESFFMDGMEVLKANQAAAENLIAAQERNRKLAQRFFTDGMEILKTNQEAAESLVAAQEGNLKYAQRVIVEYRIDPLQALSFLKAMRELHRVRLRDGAIRSGIYADPFDPERYVETFVVGSWDEHVRQHERMTTADQIMEERVRTFHIGEGPPAASHLIYATEAWVKGGQQFLSGHALYGGVHEHLPHDIQD